MFEGRVWLKRRAIARDAVWWRREALKRRGWQMQVNPKTLGVWVCNPRYHRGRAHSRLTRARCNVGGQREKK